MDSLTQATLGAAVGHLCWQKSFGRKAVIAGAVLGTLPDLDVLLYPLLDEVQRLYWHRGESHSIWFILLGSLAIGWFLSQRYKSKQLDILQATMGVFLILSTHVLIDVFTVYGTQLLAPVSRTGFALNNMFIIDPLFTVPLLFGVIGSFCIQQQVFAKRVNQTGLLLAFIYAAWSLSAQNIAHQKFNKALAKQEYNVSRQITSAGAFTTFLWRHIAQTPDGFLISYWSLFDDDSREIQFQFIPQNRSIVEDIRSTRSFEAIDWFSKGWWFAVESGPATARVVDLRFTEIPSAANQPYTEWQWPFSWSFQTEREKEHKLNAIVPHLHDPLVTLQLLGGRIQGKASWVSRLE